MGDSEITSDGTYVSTRKKRFTFNVTRDILLLKTLANLNPWQYGESQWDEAVKVFQTRSFTVTARTLKDRLATIQKAYKSQTLPKTGSEEERSERADLVEDIERMIDSARVVNTIVEIHDGSSHGLELDEEGNHYLLITSEKTGNNREADSDNPVSKKARLEEKHEAEKARESALQKMIAENSPPEPNGSRRKRTRLTEEDLIERRQAHDMEIEKRRAALEEEKEKRLYEEGKRRDELSAKQLDLQKHTFFLREIVQGERFSFVSFHLLFPSHSPDLTPQL